MGTGTSGALRVWSPSTEPGKSTWRTFWILNKVTSQEKQALAPRRPWGPVEFCHLPVSGGMVGIRNITYNLRHVNAWFPVNGSIFGVKGRGLAEECIVTKAGSESLETWAIFSPLFLLPAYCSRCELPAGHLSPHTCCFARMDASSSGTWAKRSPSSCAVVFVFYHSNRNVTNVPCSLHKFKQESITGQGED